jgi:hypothetical protein
VKGFEEVCSYEIFSTKETKPLNTQKAPCRLCRGGSGQFRDDGSRAFPTSASTAVRAFVTLPIRGFLFTLTDSPLGVVALQLLDGVAAGIFGVISIIIAADLMRGTGRFNLAQGLVALSTGLGAAASKVCAGFVVQVFGYTTGFLTLAAIAVGGLVFFALLMPETKPEEGSASMFAQGNTPTPKPA